MKKGWQIRPLGELVVQDKGGIKIGPFGSQLKKCDLVSKGIHVIGIENVLTGKFDELGERYISQEKFQTLQSVEIVPGDLLLTMMGTIGKVAVVPPSIRRSIMDSHLLRMRPDQRVIRTDYLAWAIQGSTAVLDAIEAQAHGAIMKGLNSAIVRSLPVPVLPLAEQQRIVGVLDEAFAGLATAKANAKKNLRNARALFESHLESVFTQRGKGWEEKSLGDLATFRNGINYTKESKGERIEIVGVRNFKKHFFAPLDDLDTVTIDGKLSELDSLKKDDILAVRSNGNIELIGRCILAGEVTGKISHSGFAIRIRLSNGRVTPKYVCYFLKSTSSRKLLTEGGTGTNIKSLNQGMLSALAIPFPPITAQKVLVEQLESLSEETQCLEAIYQQKLAALGELKKSLLHQAFSGEL